MQFLINQGIASLNGSCKAVSKKAKRDAAVALAEDPEAAFAKKVNGMLIILFYLYIYISLSLFAPPPS